MNTKNQRTKYLLKFLDKLPGLHSDLSSCKNQLPRGDICASPIMSLIVTSRMLFANIVEFAHVFQHLLQTVYAQLIERSVYSSQTWFGSIVMIHGCGINNVIFSAMQKAK